MMIKPTGNMIVQWMMISKKNPDWMRSSLLWRASSSSSSSWTTSTSSSLPAGSRRSQSPSRPSTRRGDGGGGGGSNGESSSATTVTTHQQPSGDGHRHHYSRSVHVHSRYNNNNNNTAMEPRLHWNAGRDNGNSSNMINNNTISTNSHQHHLHHYPHNVVYANGAMIMDDFYLAKQFGYRVVSPCCPGTQYDTDSTVPSSTSLSAQYQLYDEDYDEFQLHMSPSQVDNNTSMKLGRSPIEEDDNCNGTTVASVPTAPRPAMTIMMSEIADVLAAQNEWDAALRSEDHHITTVDAAIVHEDNGLGSSHDNSAVLPPIIGLLGIDGKNRDEDDDGHDDDDDAYLSDFETMRDDWKSMDKSREND